MNNTSKSSDTEGIIKTADTTGDGNIRYYQVFFITLVSILLLVDILFQNNEKNILVTRAWGMNNFSYFPWWIQAFAFMLLYGLAVPQINNSLRLFTGKIITGMHGKIPGKARKIWWFAGISLFITWLFYLFRVKYDLLGDMNLRVSQSTQGNYVSDEYLSMYFMHYLVIFLQKLIHFTPHQTFVFASIGEGFFYSFIGLLIADLLFADAVLVAAFFLFYMSIGTILVFCGYTEIYAIPVASVSLYMYTALLFLKKKVNIIVPFLCLVLAVALHKEQISMLPSFVFLATRKVKVLQKIDTKIILLLFLISIPLIYILNSFLHLQELMLLTKSGQFPQADTLFSFSYWWELFNSQYISSGILLFLFIAILVKTLKGQIQLDDYSKFFLIAVLFIWSIIITMNKMRGSGDWDVCSFPAIYLSMFVGYTLLTNLSALYSPKKFFYILSTAVLLSTFSCWAWIGLNSGNKSLDKIEDMLVTDPGWYYQVTLPPEMELSLLYDACHVKDRAMKYYKLSYEKYGKIHRGAITNYASMLIEVKDTDNAILVWENAVKYYPAYLFSYDQLFIM